jgi:branched-chain amino acid transport system ATP-binding protein
MTLDVNGLTAGYGSVVGAREVNLRVEPGQVVAILGANGAGKSTLLRAMSGMIRPSTGSVSYEGRDITGMGAHQIAARGVAHVPEGRELFANLTVRENLVLGGARKNRDRRAAVLADLLERFPLLAERSDQIAGTLSGGQQQLLVIARALMSEPSLLMLDEPSLGLAPKMVEQIFDTLRTVGSSGIAVLLVEQHARQALESADRAYVLRGGRVVISGTATDVGQHPSLHEAYLGL